MKGSDYVRSLMDLEGIVIKGRSPIHQCNSTLSGAIWKGDGFPHIHANESLNCSGLCFGVLSFQVHIA